MKAGAGTHDSGGGNGGDGGDNGRVGNVRDNNSDGARWEWSWWWLRW